MTTPSARRGRAYHGERYPWTYRTRLEKDADGGVRFIGERNPHFRRDMRMISRRRIM